MDTRDFVAKAYESDAFTTAQTSAGYINPEIWNKEVLKHLEANLVVAKLGKTYDDLLMKPGDTLNITVGVIPTNGAAVAESAAVPVTAYAKTQVVFTPSEHGKAYQLTDKEKTRSFISLMQDMSAELGYALAVEKDALCVSVCTAGAGNAVVANGATSGSLTSSDTIKYADIVKATVAIKKDKLKPKFLVVGNEQYGDLLNIEAFRDASQFNSDVAKSGFIGKILGLEVYETTQIITDSNSSMFALMLAVDPRGVPAFGIANKKNPSLETQRHARERYTDIVAVADYDVKVIRANGICTIESFAA